MKHTLFLLIGLLQSILFSQAQVAVVPPCHTSFVEGLEKMGGTAPGIFDGPGGTFFATGLLADSTVIIKADTSGNILWIRKFLLYTGFYQIKDLKVDKTTGDLFAIAYEQGTTFQSIIFRCNSTATAFSWIKRKTTVAYTQLHIVTVNDFIVTGTTSTFNTQLERRNKVTGNISTYSLEGQDGDYNSVLDNGRLYGTCRRYYNAAGDFRSSVFSHDATTGAFQWQNSIVSRGNTTLPTQTRMYPVAPAVDNPSQALAILSSGDLVGFSTYTTSPVELVGTQTTQTGNVIWTIQYTISNYNRPNAVAIKNTSTGYYMVAGVYLTAPLNDFGYTVVIKTDKQGNVQWARRLGISGRNIATTAVEKNGALYLSLTSDSYNINELMLVKLDQFGNSGNPCAYIQPITVTGTIMQNIQDARPYTVLANSLIETTIPTSSLPVLRTPKLYCKTDCEDSIMRMVQGKAIPSPSTITLHPNPASNTVALMMGTALSTKASVIIADQYGKIVYQGILPAGNQRLNLPISHLPAGTYTVMVYTADKQLATAKLMKQ